MFLLRNAPAFAELLRPTDTRTARLQRADVIAAPSAALIFDVTRARSHRRAMCVREFETATRSKKCMFLRSRSPRSPWRDRRRRRVEVVRLRARRPASRPAPSVRFFSRTRDKKQANCTFTSKKGHIRTDVSPPHSRMSRTLLYRPFQRRRRPRVVRGSRVGASRAVGWAHTAAG